MSLSLKDVKLKLNLKNFSIELNTDNPNILFNNKKIKLNINRLLNENEPIIKYKEELIYGIGIIIQNAIQFAKKIIIINISWTELNMIIEIIDDGKGFSREILDKIGSPHISSSKKSGMGLGIFIAINLIENIDGKILFKNNKNSNGSTVKIQLNRDILKYE